MKIIKFILVIFAILFVLLMLFLASGFITPSISYDSEVTVNKSAKEAWAVMSDEENLPKWIKGYIKTELVSGKANTVGAVSKIYVDDRGSEMVMEETIKAITPNELLAMTFTMDFMNMDYEMILKENNGKTIISTKSTTVGNGMIAKSIVSFMTGAMKEQEDVNLNSLKKLIDENTKNYFPQPEAVPVMEPAAK